MCLYVHIFICCKLIKVKVKVKMMMKISHTDSPEGTYALDYGALWAQLLKIFNT